MSNLNSIGLLEVASIAIGYQAQDAMLKAAPVDVLLARTICSGKYLIAIGGDVASVQASVDAGAKLCAGALIEKTYRASLVEWPNIAGALKIRVTVDPNGAATLVEMLEDSLDDPAVRACAYWNLRDAAYPPKKPGRYTFAFALRPPR